MFSLFRRLRQRREDRREEQRLEARRRLANFVIQLLRAQAADDAYQRAKLRRLARQGEASATPRAQAHPAPSTPATRWGTDDGQHYRHADDGLATSLASLNSGSDTHATSHSSGGTSHSNHDSYSSHDSGSSYDSSW
ncbi:hypothetical protein [Nissabacter sp. SGAir0207]|uniref:hypothetical protein n=1 Tax=Nissabacter sp. SGAir0207 TaxID=2126321 RepID=UPI0010CD23B1|nr:hypothetical protein [Nissabacter sp. SGAir0207]QCR38964.1 hypothetical protein C1N62_22895 [Nissabacter sp. SGAir0207]